MSGGDGSRDWREGVRPIRGRDARRAAPDPNAARPGGPAPDFVLEEDGSGRRADVAAKQLAALRRGEWQVAREIDLHGIAAARARALVRAGIGAARDAGERCVRVIHGRGLHSGEGAVLREALPGWLAEAPLTPHVLAWARDRRSRGGATLVLLRRARAPGAGRAR